MKGQFWRGYLTYAQEELNGYDVITTECYDSPFDALEAVLKECERKKIENWRVLKLQVFSHPNKIWKVKELKEKEK